VPPVARSGRPPDIGDEALGKRVDVNELLQERAPGVEDGDLEWSEVIELAEIRPGIFEDVAEKAADGSRAVGMLAASYAISSRTLVRNSAVGSRVAG
jgi:hypothetical protein